MVSQSCERCRCPQCIGCGVLTETDRGIEETRDVKYHRPLLVRARGIVNASTAPSGGGLQSATHPLLSDAAKYAAHWRDDRSDWSMGERIGTEVQIKLLADHGHN